MSDLNFILREMTHLRYWMPLVIEGEKRGLKSSFFVAPSNKYNCPFVHKKVIQQISKDHGVGIKDWQEAKKVETILFASENRWGIDILKTAKKATKVVCTYQTDFVESYNKFYKNIADYILMPSKFCAEFYECTEGKNLYLGIPKYDVEFSKEEVFERNMLEDENNILLIWPKLRDMSKVDMDKLLNLLLKTGYRILAKTRGKDPIPRSYKKLLKENGGRFFEDRSWHPHTTQELLSVSKLAVNFGSTTIEECVMQNVPVINFDVKPKTRNGNEKRWRVTHDYLYDYDYCIQLENDFKEKQLIASVQYLVNTNLDSEFKKSRQNHLFDHSNSSKKILDFILQC